MGDSASKTKVDYTSLKQIWGLCRPKRFFAAGEDGEGSVEIVAMFCTCLIRAFEIDLAIKNNRLMS